MSVAKNFTSRLPILPHKTIGHTGCTCTEPGFCERHGIVKNEGWWKLCQTRPDYFALWEAGVGPGQPGNSKSVKPTKKPCKEKKPTPSVEMAIEEEVARRLSICRTCQHFTETTRQRCKLVDLGCSRTLRSLLKKPSGKCPEGRWRLPAISEINCDTMGYGDCVTAAWLYHGAKAAGVPLAVAATGERARLLRIFGVEPIAPTLTMPQLFGTYLHDRKTLGQSKLTRPQSWIQALQLPAFQPLRPPLCLSDEAKRRVQLQNPYVLLCPQSNRANREWSIPLWRDLARRMELDRYNVYFLGEHRADCLDLPNWISSDDWEYSAALLSQASLVVGVDSAPVNVAGTCGVPIVAILGPTTVDALSHLGRAHWVTPPPQAISCVGCWFNPPHYQPARCKASCAAMTVNSMMTVMGVIWSTGVKGRAESDLQQPPDDVSVLNCSMHGFGDTLVAAWLAYGTREYGDKIGLHAHNRRAEMIELFGLTNYAMRPPDQQNWRERLFDKGMAFADRRSQGYPPRLWLWSNRLKLKADLVRPQHNLTDQERMAAVNYGQSNSVLFFRESTDGPRFWIEPYWDELQEELERRGYHVLNCGQAEGRHFFADHRAMAAAILNACLVVGVDSGPVHLAGTLNRPTVSLHGVTSPSVFAHMPNVRGISVDARELPCVRCYYNTWQYDTACNYTCAAMATLTPDRVLLVCLEALA